MAVGPETTSTVVVTWQPETGIRYVIVVVPMLIPDIMPEVRSGFAIVVSALLHVPLPPTVLDRTE
jgi:hypothetical protein